MFNWFNFLSYVLITAITPGPNNIMSMSNASKFGFKKSIPFNLGIWLGFSIITLFCTFLSNFLSNLIPKLKFPMLIIGAIYMLWLAWKTFKSSNIIEDNFSHNGFVSGMTLQFVNPKIYLYSIVSMEAYILPHYHSQIKELFAFALLLAFIGFICTLLWSLFGSIFKVLFSKYAKIVNSIMSLFLVYCALSLFF